MGWLQLSRRQGQHSHDSASIDARPKQGLEQVEDIEHIEHIQGHCAESVLGANQTQRARKYPFLPQTTPDYNFPLIPKDEVLSKRRPGALSTTSSVRSHSIDDCWIVVDNVVYDCTEFIEEHPGGEQVILSFLGEDCSWQFWRFHGREQMEQSGRPLRIGRTNGIENRFKEPSRFVGLSKLGNDEW